MPHLHFGSTYWSCRREPEVESNRFPTGARVETEVAIVGGGFTGCVSAYVFARAGIPVALFERGAITQGSTCASTALLMQEPDRGFVELVRRYGHVRARRVWRTSRRALRQLTAALERTDCGLRYQDSVHIARDPAAARALTVDYKARRTAGLAGRLLSEAAVTRTTGIHANAGILTKGGAVVDPVRAALAFAREAKRAGADFYERTTVHGVTKRGGGVHLSTTRGPVDARIAVVATGFATPEFEPLRARFRMSTTYVIATAPLSLEVRTRIGAGRVMLWDRDRPYHYLRWTDDGRILFGGLDGPVPATPAARRAALAAKTRQLQDDLHRLYPDEHPFEISYAWDGLFATTPDGFPYIGPHRRYPGHLFALGYGGNGMTFALLAASILMDHYRGRRHRDADLFRFDRFR